MNEETKNEKDNWTLYDLQIEQIRWGANKGSYNGKIKFINGESEQFNFNLSDELTSKYIALIKDEVVRSATELGKRIAASLENVSKPKGVDQ